MSLHHAARRQHADMLGDVATDAQDDSRNCALLDAEGPGGMRREDRSGDWLAQSSIEFNSKQQK